MRLEKCAGGHWIWAQPLPNPRARVTQEGFSWERKAQMLQGATPKRALMGPQRLVSLFSVRFWMICLWGHLPPSLECKAPQGRVCVVFIHLCPRSVQPRAWYRWGLGKGAEGKE